MIQRCESLDGDSSDYYYKKGIKVCDRWRDKNKGFFNFIEDMGQRPKGYSLDRIDPNKDYCPENCQWADSANQSYNQRLQGNNKSGCTGVWLSGKDRKVWSVAISKGGETYYYGGYESFDDAVNVRVLAEMEMYGYSVTLRDMGISESDIDFGTLYESFNKRSSKNPLDNLQRNSKLSEVQKIEIKEKYKPYVKKKAPNGFLKKMADEYGVSHSVINRIVKQIKED